MPAGGRWQTLERPREGRRRGRSRARPARSSARLHPALRRSSRSPRGSATRASRPATSPWSRTRRGDTRQDHRSRNSSTRSSPDQPPQKQKSTRSAETRRQTIRRNQGSGDRRPCSTSIWIEGQAEEMGISVTPKEVDEELKKLKKQNFKTEAEYQKFLKESHYTAAGRQRAGEAADAEQRRSRNRSPKARPNRAKRNRGLLRSREGEPVHDAGEPRRPRLIVNKDKAKVEAAQGSARKRRLDRKLGKGREEILDRSDDAEQRRAAAGRTEDRRGGTARSKAIFARRAGQLEGPMKGEQTATSCSRW